LLLQLLLEKVEGLQGLSVHVIGSTLIDQQCSNMNVVPALCWCAPYMQVLLEKVGGLQQQLGQQHSM
jgi:hypothetical protein